MGTLLTGGTGRLGRELVGHLKVDWAPTSREMDVTDERAVASCLETTRPARVVHAAALADVRRAEREPELAFRVNVLGAFHVAKHCARLGCPMVYISTDHVFDGRKGGYAEEDPPNRMASTP